MQFEDLDDLQHGPRRRVSRVSYEASGLLAGREVGGYVAPAQLDDLVRESLLTPAPAGKGNVCLRVAEDTGGVPIAFVVADLAIRSDVRERQAAALLSERLRHA